MEGAIRSGAEEESGFPLKVTRGRLTTVRNENGPGLVDLLFYDYDTAGRLARVTVRPMGGGDRIAESYEYDSAGRKKKTLYVDLAAQRPNTQYAWGVEGTDSSYSAPGAATLTTLYNGREQPTDLLFYDEAGRLLSRVEFRYDRDGNLVEEAQTNAAEIIQSELLTSLNQRSCLRRLRRHEPSRGRNPAASLRISSA
jgi:hypothetical protein